MGWVSQINLLHYGCRIQYNWLRKSQVKVLKLYHMTSKYKNFRSYFRSSFLKYSTVILVLATTFEQQPPVNNDHYKSRPSNLSTKSTSEQQPLVSYDQWPHKNVHKWFTFYIKTCLQQPFYSIFSGFGISIKNQFNA